MEVVTIREAVRLTAVLTRNDYTLGARAFRLWKESCYPPSSCVELACSERRMKSEIKNIEDALCPVPSTPIKIKIIKYYNGSQDVDCEHSSRTGGECHYPECQTQGCTLYKKN